MKELSPETRALEARPRSAAERSPVSDSDARLRAIGADHRPAARRLAQLAAIANPVPPLPRPAVSTPGMARRAGSISTAIPTFQASGDRASPAVLQRHSTGVIQLSIMSRMRWGGYLAGLHGQVACDAIDTGEARTTLENTVNAQGHVTHRTIYLHTYTNDAWHEIGHVKMDRTAVHMGPALPGHALPLAGYDDSQLTLHTAAHGGNAGVATHLFPAVIRWIDTHLRGVQQLHMNPAGGAASKSVIATLAGAIGNAQSHRLANVARTARQTAGGAGIGSGVADAALRLNTWDTRLNAEHHFDLESLDLGTAGLSLSADNMSLAGPAQPADILAMQAHRDAFVGRPGAHFTQDPTHPAAGVFAAARALTDPVIAANPRAAARTLRIARLSQIAGPTGLGAGLDPGYQMSLGGAALTSILPRASA